MISLRRLLSAAVAAIAAFALPACAPVEPIYDCGNVTVSTVGSLAGSSSSILSIASDGRVAYFVVDQGSQVFKIDLADGTTSVLAGSSSPGFANGTGTAAAFSNPSGLALNGSTLYVADSNNSALRAIDVSTGVTTTVAGGASAGFADGPATSALFNQPGQIVYAAGKLYVADTGNARLRSFDPVAGVVSTLAGGGPNILIDAANGAAAGFISIHGLAFDGAHSLYASDNYFQDGARSASAIRKVDMVTGAAQTVAGNMNYFSTGVDGSADVASFGYVGSMSFFNQTLYVADASSNRIRTFDVAQGQVRTLAGSDTPGNTDGSAATSTFQTPLAVAVVDGNATGVRVLVGSLNKVRLISELFQACPATNFAVTGAVHGLDSSISSSVSLDGAAAGSVSLATDGVFTFPKFLAAGAPYAVSVTAQPSYQVCSVRNGTGNAGAYSRTVQVECVYRSYRVGGTVAGLSGGTLQLRDNFGTAGGSAIDQVQVAANGSFVFPTLVQARRSYSVSVASAPAGQSCVVANGTGTMGFSDVTDISITCSSLSAPTYTVGGAVTGITGAGQPLTLQNNAGDTISVNSDGAFTFPTALTSGAAYSASVLSSPAGYTCSIANGSGSVATSNVSNIAVTCSAQPTMASIGGIAYNLLYPGLVLQNNLGDDLSVFPMPPANNSVFSFATPLAAGSTYDVTVLVQPANQTCTVSNGSGTANASVSSVVVNCQ